MKKKFDISFYQLVFSFRQITKFFIYFSLFLNFLFSEVFAQTIRFTSFDDRPICESMNGLWRQFGNGCADDCEAKFDQLKMCSGDLIRSCDCGNGRCWDGEGCVSMKSYKKIYDKAKAEEDKILAQKKEERRLEAKENQDLIMGKLIQDASKRMVVDPNSKNQKNNMAQFYDSASPDNKINDPNNPKAVQNAQGQNINENDQITQVTAVPVIPTSATPITLQPATGAAPEIPPMFLQQEQENAKKAALANAKIPAQAGDSNIINNSAGQKLPNIPMPK